MAAEGESSTDRVSVKTYVPAYQRAEWDDHADELDMSRSEFVRTMVQAGRRGFEPTDRETRQAGQQSPPETATEQPADSTPAQSTDADSQSSSTADTARSTADTTDLEDRVVALLDGTVRSWDELFEALTDDIEERLEDTLAELQDTNRVRYSGRDGGYELVQ